MTADTQISPEAEFEAIALSAYYRYIERRCEDGHDLEDWLSSEAELRAEAGSVALERSY